MKKLVLLFSSLFSVSVLATGAINCESASVKADFKTSSAGTSLISLKTLGVERDLKKMESIQVFDGSNQLNFKLIQAGGNPLIEANLISGTDAAAGIIKINKGQPELDEEVITCYFSY